jgi:hypothetical protein
MSLNKNIIRTYIETWDPVAQRYNKTYLPFTNRAFSSGVTMGQTQADGTLRISKDTITQDDYDPPY